MANDARIRNSNPKDDFTIVTNKVIRSKDLSPNARFLYMFIRSYITLQGFTIYKNFIKTETTFKKETFNRAWKELKDKGYLIQYRICGNKGHFKYEYELLLEPRINSNGGTKHDSENPPHGENLPHGEKLPYGEETIQWSDQQLVQPVAGKPPLSNNTYISKTDIKRNDQSIKLIDEQKKDLIIKELSEKHELPQLCLEDTAALSFAIKHLSKQDVSNGESHCTNPAKQTVMENSVNALIEMATGYSKYNSTAIIQKISETIINDNNHDLYNLLDVASRNYMDYCTTTNIGAKVPYLQKIIYNAFDTYRLDKLRLDDITAGENKTKINRQRVEELVAQRQDTVKEVLQKRRIEVFKKHPEIKEIDDSITMLHEQARAALLAKKIEDINKINTERQELDDHLKQSLVNAGYEHDYLENYMICQLCNDTGFTNTTGEYCGCVKEELNAVIVP